MKSFVCLFWIICSPLAIPALADDGLLGHDIGYVVADGFPDLEAVTGTISRASVAALGV